MISVRHACPEDAPVPGTFRAGLWPDDAEATHRREVERFFEGSAPELLAILAAEDAGCSVGFADLSIRPWSSVPCSSR